ncbi:uncharacterized protein LOC110188942 isoform X2 [Drosophila serrata]|nr:uncharacterized protein LOC110188942 isoform X2 [Drosophila serrata]
MKYLLLLIACLAYSSALVHFKQLEKGANGCKMGKLEMKVSDTVQDPEVCGVYQCMNTKGEALIY